MTRWNAESKVYLLCGCIFCAVGLLFLALCGLMVTHMDSMIKNSEGDVRFLPVIFGFVGGIIAIVGAAVLIWYGRSKRKVNRLLERGEYIVANIIGFPIDYRVTINGRPTYRVECSYQDPATGTLYVFQSKNVFIDPAYCVTAETVRVYVDKRSGYKDYYVDVDPILPQIEMC